MDKLVIIKIGEGNLEQGFPVILQIGDEHTRPSVEITGSLPANPEISRHYHHWKSIYRNLKLASRPIGLPKPTISPNTLEECQQAADNFKVHFNNWLAADSFRPIREKFLEKLSLEDNIRILLQTKDFQLQQLPWHLWELLEHYQLLTMMIPPTLRINLRWRHPCPLTTPRSFRRHQDRLGDIHVAQTTPRSLKRHQCRHHRLKPSLGLSFKILRLIRLI